MLEKIQDVGELYKIIVFETGHNDEQVATALGYTRSHFNRLINGERSEKVDSALRDKMKKGYAKEIAQFVRRWSGVNSGELDEVSEVVAKTQVAIVELILNLAREKKTVYNKSIEILAKHGLKYIGNGMSIGRKV